jgi:hypothetical protein
MKRAFLAIILLLIFWIGCTRQPTAPTLGAPQNLKISSIEKGLGLKLEWDNIEDADGYFVYFVNVKSDTESDTAALAKVIQSEFYDLPKPTSQTGLPSSIMERGCGDYYVIPEKIEYDKVWLGDASETVSSRPAVSKSCVLYERNLPDSCAYGWDENGNGERYSISDATNEWDIYLDDGDSTTTDTAGLYLVSPTDSVGGNSSPTVNWDATYIVISTSENTAPLDITTLFASVEKDGIYYLKVDTDYYVKVVIDSLLDNGIIFNYSFQKLKGFRRF